MSIEQNFQRLGGWIQPHTQLILAFGSAVLIIVVGAFLLTSQKPQVMDFALHQKVSATSSLQFRFPVTMDHRSAEGSMVQPSDLSGSWSWNGEVLLFKPETSLKSGATYSFQLNATALKSDGEPLGRELTYVFTVAGPPKVAARLPAPDARNINPASSITLVFDRPMIPLTQVQGEAATARMENFLVTISPSVAGRWRWLSTVAVTFEPSDGLVPATRYTVSVPKGMKTALGEETQEDFSWNFETLRPAVLSTEPEEGFTLAGPTTSVVLHMNQEMDLAKAKESLRLEKIEGDRDKPASHMNVPMHDLHFGTREIDKKKVEDPQAIVVLPQKPFAFNGQYELTLVSGLRAARGDLGSGCGFTLHFGTVGNLQVVNGGLEYGALAITFSNPLDEESLKGNVTISPAVVGWKDLTWIVDEWVEKRKATLNPTLTPSTTYTVTVGTGVKDSFGQHLEKPYTFTITTAPVPPKIFIHSNGTFGIFERGKPPIYYLNGVNVSRLDVEFSKLTLQDFLSLRQTNRSNWGNTGPHTLQGREGFQSWTVTPKKKNDEWQSIPFDIEKKLGQSLASGIYAFSMRAPEYVREYDHTQIVEYQYFALTNIALTVKHSGDRALVWAVELQTGNPVAGAAIGIHALSGRTVITGTTDKNGFFDTPIDIRDFPVPNGGWEAEFWVTAEKDGDFAFVGSNWHDGFPSDISMDLRSPQSPSLRVDSYIYTERPLYRAGDSVDFKGIVRLRDWNGDFTLPPKERQVQVKISDPNGSEVFNKTFPFSEFGTFNGNFPVDPKAPLGSYYLSAQLTPDSDLMNQYAVTNFSVLAYRKPEYRIDVKPEKEDYFDGDTVRAEIEGAYYFGAPMPGAPVIWRAETTDYFFNKFHDGWYNFALEESWCYWNCNRQTALVAEGKGTLDAEGHLSIAVPVSLKDKAVSQVLSIEADVTDPNNQLVSNRSSVMVHKANVYVGVKSDDYVVTPGKEAGISVVTVRPDGSLLPGQTVTLSLFSRKWNTIRKKGVDGEYYYDNQPEDTFIRDTSVTTNENGKTTAKLLIEKGGEFRVVASAKDASGREAKSSASLYAWSDTYFNWPHSNTNTVEIVVDKPEYAVGDTAKLLVKSPFQGKGVKALVTVEREGIISHRVIDVTSNALPIEIPVTAQAVPNAYVSVIVVKPRTGETFNENGLDTGAPAFRVGMAKLVVDTSSKVLHIGVVTDKDQYLPGEKVTVTLKTTDAKGQPARAELSLAGVDMSLLALSGFELPNLVKIFYAERPLGVETAQMLTYLLERFKPGSKGGGGGELETHTRGTFKDTALWNPIVVTDAKGEASVTFTLPDNLTTWHLLAIGTTKEHTFGATDKTFIATKRVILRPVRPRFAVRGDEVELGALVHNFLKDSATFTVSLTGSGFTHTGSASRQITLASSTQGKVSFPVRISSSNSATFTFEAKSGDARDAITERIPVYPYGTPQSVATTGITENVATEKVLVPTKADASDGTLTATISPSIATYLPKGLEYLAHYPYGCAEQVLSSVVPSIALTRLQGFDAFKIVDDARLHSIVTSGLETLYTFQRGDGGFGYWPESERSYPYLSAYVLYAFDLMQKSNFPVDSGVMSRTREYLNSELRTQEMDKPVNLATRAYILYVLGENGQVDQSLLSNLFEKRDKLPLFSRAHLAMALSKAGVSGKARQLMTEIENHAKVDGREAHFEEEDGDLYAGLMHTNDRTTAIVLQAMLRIDPENTLIPTIVRYLLSTRKDGHWDTTQSTTMSLLALVEYLKATKELEGNFAAGIEINGKKLLDWKVTKENILTRKDVALALDDLNRGVENEVTIGKVGEGRLYYDLQMSYFYTGDTLPPAEEGMSIQRSFKALEGQKPDVTVGNTYKVTLTITVPQERHFVSVVSPLPAGMEIVDTQLKTSQQNLLAGETSANRYDQAYWDSGLWYFRHSEYRDDQLFLFADVLPAGVYQYQYLVRATTPGRYHLRPAHVEEMYFPEVFGQTSGEWFTVKE